MYTLFITLFFPILAHCPKTIALNENSEISNSKLIVTLPLVVVLLYSDDFVKPDESTCNIGHTIPKIKKKLMKT